MNILVIGASRGLGNTLALLLHQQGHQVWGMGRTSPASPSPFPFHYLQCDITNRAQAYFSFQQLIPMPEVIVYCAGRAFDDITEDAKNQNLLLPQLHKNFELNCFGFLKTIDFFLPLYLKEKRGHFIYISSLSAIRENHRQRIGYSSSKLATNKILENLRMQYFCSNIKFTTVNFGRLHHRKHALIGINYQKASKKIAHIICNYNRSNRCYYLPKLQTLLTYMTKFIPSRLYKKLMSK
ncbi:MAG: SDR family NAD(P)-dependent oxidoreductase [Oligoflexia bacterium]|nr:SDR family NAD(P)-dependent oxidoreductase [Oligoflexia bacterium]